MKTISIFVLNAKKKIKGEALLNSNNPSLDFNIFYVYNDWYKQSYLTTIHDEIQIAVLLQWIFRVVFAMFSDI